MGEEIKKKKNTPRGHILVYFKKHLFNGDHTHLFKFIYSFFSLKSTSAVINSNSLIQQIIKIHILAKTNKLLKNGQFLNLTMF